MEPIIHHRVHLACDALTAYEHFIQNDLLVRFFTKEADVEPHVGGKYELAWDPENKPQNSTVGCRITAMAAGQLLAFDWRGPAVFEAIMNHARPLTHVVITFHAVGDGVSSGCDVNLIHSGWRPGPGWAEARHYFDRAWVKVLSALAELVTSPSPITQS